MLIKCDVDFSRCRDEYVILDINYKISFLLITYPCDYNDVLGDRFQQLQSV